jgi:hypothetical protein
MAASSDPRAPSEGVTANVGMGVVGLTLDLPLYIKVRGVFDPVWRGVICLLRKI